MRMTDLPEFPNQAIRGLPRLNGLGSFYFLRFPLLHQWIKPSGTESALPLPAPLFHS